MVEYINASPPVFGQSSGEKNSAISHLDSLYFTLWVFVILLSSDAFTRLGLNTPLWYLTYAVVGFFTLLRLPQFLRVFADNQTMLLLSYLAILSVTWSIMPNRTLLAALQLFATNIIGLYFGMVLGIRRLLWGIVLAGAIGITVSMFNLHGAFGRAYGDVGGFLGIFLQKNMFAKLICISQIAAGALLMGAPSSKNQRLFLWIFIVALFYPLLLTKSVSSILISAIFLTSSFAIALLSKPVSRFFLINLMAAFLAGLTIFIVWQGVNLSEIFQLLGKDSTLTGRTDIWQIGLTRFYETPIWGHGFAAYWGSPRYASEVILIRANFGEGVASFHNIIVSTLVAYGLLGLIPLFIYVCTPMVRTLFVVINSDGQIRFLWIGVGILLFAIFFMSLFGTMLFRQHELTIILFPAIAVIARKNLADWATSQATSK